MSTRDDLAQLQADAGFVAQLVKMQQQTQDTGFRHHYPQAAHWLIEKGGAAVGRAVVDSAPAGLRLVDLAVAPAQRRAGIARAVLLALQREASLRGVGLELAVARNNPAARALYLALGFAIRSTDEIVEQMRWPA